MKPIQISTTADNKGRVTYSVLTDDGRILERTPGFFLLDDIWMPSRWIEIKMPKEHELLPKTTQDALKTKPTSGS